MVFTCGSPQEIKIKYLIRKLRSENVSVCLSASEKLFRIGEPAVLALMEALNDKDARARAGAAEALGRISSWGGIDAPEETVIPC